ncbi:hypothetical protein CVT26_013314, partial [Gymnopilus dilepis]
SWDLRAERVGVGVSKCCRKKAEEDRYVIRVDNEDENEDMSVSVTYEAFARCLCGITHRALVIESTSKKRRKRGALLITDKQDRWRAVLALVGRWRVHPSLSSSGVRLRLEDRTYARYEQEHEGVHELSQRAGARAIEQGTRGRCDATTLEDWRKKFAGTVDCPAEAGIRV